MPTFNDPHDLKSDSDRDAADLGARAAFHRRFSTNPYGWLRWVFDTLLRLPADARILELGCGNGLLWKENAERIPAGWKVTLSDPSPEMLDAAWRNLVVTGRAFQFKEIDAESIPFEDGTFDAVVASHMLYPVPNWPKAFTEIRRVLKSGGRLIATAVGEKHMKEMNDWLSRLSGGNLFGSYSLPFALENGAEPLKEFFENVSISRYPDSLEVTDVEPVMASIRSGIAASHLLEDELSRVRGELEKELQEKGRILLSKDAGLLEAIK